MQLLSLTLAVFDWGQSDAVLQQILFGPMVHGGADGQHGARLLLLQQVWRQKNRQIHTVTYNKMHSHNLKHALNWSCSIKLKAVPGLSLLFMAAEDFLCDSEETKTKCKKKVGFKGPNNQTTFQICNSFCFVLGYLLVQNCSLSWLHLPHPQTAPVLSLLSVLRPALRSSPAVQLLRPLVASCSSSSA